MGVKKRLFLLSKEEIIMLINIVTASVTFAGTCALCIACYLKGKKAGKKIAGTTTAVQEQQEQNALMKKYETIIGYDPYGENI